MIKALLVGNYGAGNIGDDLLMRSSIQQLNKLNIEFKIVSTGDVHESISMPPAGVRSFIKFKWIVFFRELFRTDVVVFGGGGLLNPEEPMSLLIWGQVIVWACLFKKKIYMAGQSFSRVNWLLRILLKRVEFVSVRDKFSYDLVKGIINEKVALTQDLAWYLDVESANTFSSNSVSLNLREYKHVNFLYLKKCVIGLLDEMSKRFDLDKVYLLPFGLGDIKFAKLVLQNTRYESKIVEVDQTLENCIDAISKSRISICERLHASIMCMHLEGQLVSLSYSSKVFALLDLYMQDALINLRSESDVDFERIVNQSIARKYKKPRSKVDEAFKRILLR